MWPTDDRSDVCQYVPGIAWRPLFVVLCLPRSCVLILTWTCDPCIVCPNAKMTIFFPLDMPRRGLATSQQFASMCLDATLTRKRMDRIFDFGGGGCMNSLKALALPTNRRRARSFVMSGGEALLVDLAQQPLAASLCGRNAAITPRRGCTCCEHYLSVGGPSFPAVLAHGG